MRKKVLATTVAATAALLAVGSLGLAGTAKADPTGSETYNAVGSDTTMDVIAALAGQTVTCNPPETVGSGTLTGVGSYEALEQDASIGCTNSTNITVGGITMTRPNGSGNGVQALSASVDPSGGDWTVTNSDGSVSPVAIGGTLQFSRSSSGPSTSGTSGEDPLTYVPFARDAVGYVYVAGSGLTSAESSAVASLSTANLTSIYEGGTSPVSGVTFEPYLPQSGSGTRNFFQGVIGVPNGSLGSDVNQNSTNEENTANVIGDLSVPADTVAVYPFSISSYIAQNNGFTADTGIESVQLGNPDGDNPVSSGSGINLAPNTSFYATHWGRDVYDVFPTSDVTDFENGTPDSYTSLLDQFLITSANPSPAITSTASNTIITDFGFLTESYDDTAGTSSNNVSTSPTAPYSFAEPAS